MTTFDYASEVNRSRAAEWHRDGEVWTLADWSNATLGEVGELAEVFATLVAHAGQAGNTVKKIRRLDTGTGGRYSEQDRAALVEKAKREVADVYLYLDLFLEQLDPEATMYGVVRNKFNATSEEFGFTHRLEPT